MADEYYLENFGYPEERYHDFSDQKYDVSDYGATRLPLVQSPRKRNIIAPTYNGAPVRSGRNDTPVRGSAMSPLKTKKEPMANNLLPNGMNVNAFMFIVIMIFFMCLYTMYGVMSINKELVKLRKLLKTMGRVL